MSSRMFVISGDKGVEKRGGGANLSPMQRLGTLVIYALAKIGTFVDRG
jgi:hypothetical protein